MQVSIIYLIVNLIVIYYYYYLEDHEFISSGYLVIESLNKVFILSYPVKCRFPSIIMICMTKLRFSSHLRGVLLVHSLDLSINMGVQES